MQTIKKYFEFSKLVTYVILILMTWSSYKVIGFADVAIQTGYTGSLPFLTTMITAIWGAGGTVISFVFNKSKAENVIKIKNSAFSKDEYDTYRETEVQYSEDRN